MRLIKRYPNKKLYDTKTSMWISHEDLYTEIQLGEKVKVIDKDGLDITFKTMVSCLWKVGKNTGPVNILEELIRSE